MHSHLDEKSKKRNTVMKITISRIIIAFLLIPIYLLFGPIATSISAAIGFLTDALDGKLSRKWDVRTILGKIMDPIGDRLITLITYSILAFTISPVFWITLIAELGISAIALGISSKYNNHIKSTKIGKIKAALIGVIGIGSLACLNKDMNDINHIVNYLVIGVGVTQVAGAISYVKQNTNQIKIKKEQGLSSNTNIYEFSEEDLKRLNIIKDIQTIKEALIIHLTDLNKRKELRNKLYDIEYSKLNERYPLIDNLINYYDENGNLLSKGEVQNIINKNKL